MAKEMNFFLGYAALAAGVTAVCLWLVWAVMKPGLAYYISDMALAVDIFFGLLLCGTGLLFLLLLMLGFTSWEQPVRIRQILLQYIGFLYPVMRKLAWTDTRKEMLARSYIQFLNGLVLKQNLRIPAEQVLILAPHCLQWDQCPHKITRCVDNCRQCGHCTIGSLLAVSRSLGAHLAVASGGTQARQLVGTLRPRAIVAIACERDLISGMEDVLPLPVLGLLNERPYGPCFNTQVDVPVLCRLLERLTGEDYERTRNSISQFTHRM